MRKTLLFSGLIVISGVIVSFVVLNKSITPDASLETPVVSKIEDDGEFKWYSVEEAIEQNKISHKKIFMDVYTTWCGPCKWLDANTFSNPRIRQLLSTYYIPTKFDAESSDTIYFKDKTFVNPNPGAAARMSTHEFTIYIATTERGIAYPTMVFLDENMDMIQPISGALSAEQLEPILDYIGQDYYKNTPWETYSQSYISNIKK
ncbi:MAG TPA: thioredoxin family protein [Chitinophagales bacterium]|nr:thioredoxin family protein [Chitinophagales bacterium]